MTTSNYTVTQVNTGTINLSVLRLGNPEAPAVMMLHGLRDTAWSLLPVADQLHRQLQVQIAIIELRGHGASGHSEAYAMPNFLMDVYEVADTLPTPMGLFGHSLGGHLTYKFSALFPELVDAAMIVEGLGPPGRPHLADETKEIANYREMLLSRLRRSGGAKPLTGLEDATQRLLRGNTRLNPERARVIAEHLVQETPDGLQWAFDPRAASVFIGADPHTDAKFWRGVKAPTCIVSGRLAHEYWGREFSPAEFSGHFAPGEMEQRVAQFANAEHHWFDQSGHMVHYDEPERLAELAIQFFGQHLFTR